MNRKKCVLLFFSLMQREHKPSRNTHTHTHTHKITIVINKEDLPNNTDEHYYHYQADASARFPSV